MEPVQHQNELHQSKLGHDSCHERSLPSSAHGLGKLPRWAICNARQDIYGAVLYAVSKASDFVTGHELVVDGGHTVNTCANAFEARRAPTSGAGRGSGGNAR
jgi:hypothetical protein